MVCILFLGTLLWPDSAARSMVSSLTWTVQVPAMVGSRTRLCAMPVSSLPPQHCYCALHCAAAIRTEITRLASQASHTGRTGTTAVLSAPTQTTSRLSGHSGDQEPFSPSDRELSVVCCVSWRDYRCDQITTIGVVHVDILVNSL